MALLDYQLLGEVDRLTAGNHVQSPRRKRDRFGRWQRDDKGELDWFYILPEVERAYLLKRYFRADGVEVDVLADICGMSSDEWGEAFVSAVRAARDRTLRDADLFSDEWEEASASRSGDGGGYDGDVDLSELAGMLELAEMLGYPPNTVAVWRKRYADFPAPVLTLSGTMIWRKSEVRAWAERSGRLKD